MAVAGGEGWPEQTRFLFFSSSPLFLLLLLFFFFFLFLIFIGNEGVEDRRAVEGRELGR